MPDQISQLPIRHLFPNNDREKLVKSLVNSNPGDSVTNMTCNNLTLVLIAGVP